ncbi:MAG: PrgI family protein [Candidatus Gracilibacteria bacterium]|jgi:hypothetical protein
MQFKVPQDVQREDTIIGPITLKQLIILGMGGGLAYAIYVSLAKAYFVEIWLPPVAIVLALTVAFAFLKIYNMTFEKFLMSFFEYRILSRKRIWIQGAGKPQYLPELIHKTRPQKMIKNTKNKKSLTELTSILDTHGSKELNEAESKLSK